jgi:xanthine dehydrogenase small subunit
VWVDGSPRVACVTPARRVVGRRVTTLEGLDPQLRRAWSEAFTRSGASQCGFCTPGIIMRLAALLQSRGRLDEAAVKNALLAHLCRCTGWRTIFDAARLVGAGMGEGASASPAFPPPQRDTGKARERATIETGSPQHVGPEIALGEGGFADDLAPADCAVAVPGSSGEFSVGESVARARVNAHRVQGRNTTVPIGHPLEIPEGDWALSLRTTFVEPAYLEPDASWCEPGGQPVTPLANGGAFGGKLRSPVADVARRLACEQDRAVRVLFGREDVVRMGPKRPPVAAALREDGSGIIRVGRTPGSDDLADWVTAVRRVLPRVEVEEVLVHGPPVSSALRGAGWAEAVAMSVALDAQRAGLAQIGTPLTGHRVTVEAPNGARCVAELNSDGSVSVALAAGEVLDEVVLRSYAIGAVHQALGWVRSEGIAVADDGEVLDLTIRSFGIINAKDMPPVTVYVEADDRPALRIGDAVFAAVSAAAWLAGGLVSDWPISRRSRGRPLSA